MDLSFKSRKPLRSGQRPVKATKPAAKPATPKNDGKPREIGGPEGPEPTRYGDWERKGICVDF